jgi:NTP-dependent ternary system trypsin peptidase co-occuring protein
MPQNTRIVEVELDDGEIIHAEVRATGGTDVSIADRLRLEQAGEAITRIGSWAARTVRAGVPELPDEFEVSFGLKLGAKSGKLIGILAEASSEASLTVRMKWDKTRNDSEDPSVPGTA